MSATCTVPEDQARELAERMADRVRSGADERELFDLAANALRIKKRAAWEVVEEFKTGYEAGVQASLGVMPAEPRASPLWEHAFRMGHDFTASLIASVGRGRGGRRGAVLRGLLVLLVAGLLIALARCV